MITKVVHGWRVAGVIAYLMGPGRAQEHVRPRVIATWDGRTAAWQPVSTGSADHDLDLGPLIRAMRAPGIAAGLPESAQVGRRGYVWHMSARLAAGDRVLSDAEWAEVVRELLDGAGVAARSDHGGARWVAIRHADDHVHVAAVLVRQDTCRRFWAFRDFRRLRVTAQRIERRLGLSVSADADGTAAPRPSRGEREKAVREGREPARTELARLVRVAAVTASGVAEFVEALSAAQCVVELRFAPSGDAIGYKVARSGDLTADGRPVFYSGSKLAPDLSLPKLVAAWKSGVGGQTADPERAAARRVSRAGSAVAAARRGEAGEDPAGIAHATADVLTAIRTWSPDHAMACDQFDRVCRSPRGSSSSAGPASSGLRQVARELIRARHVTGSWNDPGAGGIALVVALAALLREIAAWQRREGRLHQSGAAVAAAETLSRTLGRRATDNDRSDTGVAVGRKPAPELDASSAALG